MALEQQHDEIVVWMQNNQDITKAYIHCMQNCPVWKEFYGEYTKPNLMNMADFVYGFWKSGEWKLILPRKFVFAGQNYYESWIEEAHIAIAHVRVEKTMQYQTDRHPLQSVSGLV